MKKTVLTGCITLIAVITLLGQEAGNTKAATTKSRGAEAKIRLAMSAAPLEIGKDATIMEVDKSGQMTQLREGTNGWTCMVSAGGAAGAAGANPMCLDATWMKWADAWIHKKDVNISSTGVAYMLRGDKGASNTDPYATGPTADNQWVVSPPHIMVLVADTKQLDALPTDPHNGGPWVMWKGTPYAHIMVPLRTVPAAHPATPKKAKPEATPGS